MLGLVRFAQQLLFTTRVFARINSVLRHELFCNVIHQAAVPVNASQVHIASGRDRVVIVALDFHDGNIERSTAKVINQHAFGLTTDAFFIQEPCLHTESDRRGGWLVDDIHHLQPRDPASILSSLSARLVEKSWHCDNNFFNIAQQQLRVRFQFAKHQCLQDFGWKLAAQDLFAVSVLANVTLGIQRQAIRFKQTCLDRFDADNWPRMIKKHGARRRQIAFRIADRFGTAVSIQIGDGRKSCPKVNTDRRMLFRICHVYKKRKDK